MPELIRKFLSGPATVLGERQVRVRCSSSALDRAGDKIVQAGILHAASVPVLWSHDPEQPIGRATPGLIDGDLFATIDFAPAGISKLADEICGLTKAGVITGVSIGFDPIESTPIDPKQPYGGRNFTKVELLELSMVSVPCNEDAEVVGRSHAKSGRVLSGASRDKLQQAHDLVDKGRSMIAGMLDETADPDPEKARRIRRAKALGLALGPPVYTPPGPAPRVPMSRDARIARAAALGSAAQVPRPELAPCYRAASDLGTTISEELAKQIIADCRRSGLDLYTQTKTLLMRRG